jgi:hypothetical protein
MNSIATTHIQTRHPPFISRFRVQESAIRVPARRDRAVHLLLISCFGTRLCRQERKMSIQRLVLSIAVVTALMLPLTALPGGAQAGRAAQHPSLPGDPATALRQDLRKLWTDHVVWTRNYIVAAVADQPDAQAAASRLMKNQEDIGGAVGKIYGAAAGQQLTTLLKEHISIAVDLIKAAKASDKAGQQLADGRWQQNAEQIADFLSKANPQHWPRATLVDMMKVHLSTTTSEVVARLTKNWDDDVRTYDAVYDHILKMSDALADGIVKQFPDKFVAR